MTAAVVATAPVAWFVVASWQAGRWLGGGSAAGLTCGIASGLIIGLAMLLWPRKYFRRLRLLPARHWMAAHLWLGLASLPLGVFHCGFHLGGALPTALMWVFVLAIFSGIYGFVVQNIIPVLSLRWLPTETIYSQIDHVAEQNLRDVRRAIEASCGPRELVPAGASTTLESEPAVPPRSTIVIGAVRSSGMVRGRTLRTQTVTVDIEDREILWKAVETIEPYLAKGRVVGGPMTRAASAAKWFAELRSACSPKSLTLVAALENCYQQRQQFDLQRRLHHWLHGWLPVHIGLSVAASILLVVHVLTALKYW